MTNIEMTNTSRVRTRFSAEECNYLDRRYEQIRSRIEINMLIPPELPHIINRLKTIAAMSYDELMGEIEADYVIFKNCPNTKLTCEQDTTDIVGAFKELGFEAEKKLSPEEWDRVSEIQNRYRLGRTCDNVRSWLVIALREPNKIPLQHNEDLYIWERLEALSSLSREALTDLLEADHYLFLGCS